VRGSEDLIRLIRHMQELWLFGKLDDVSELRDRSDDTDLVDLVSQMITVASKKRHEELVKAA
jgi:hypothetical protein